MKFRSEPELVRFASERGTQVSIDLMLKSADWVRDYTALPEDARQRVDEAVQARRDVLEQRRRQGW